MKDVTTVVELLVCIKCKRGKELAEDGESRGAVLFKKLAASELPECVALIPVNCLQNCHQGCSVVMRGGGHRWTYVYGNLHEASDAPLLIEGISLYRDTQDGVIPWRQRPEHFKRNCVARIPPLSLLKKISERARHV